ncbi:MAG: fucose isomerase [Spirochaetales bacterium]|nr:fucose isomerase [Spirochaetales bacterium]
MKKINIGLIVGTRGFFPSSLAEQGRKDIISKLENSGFNVIIPAENSTPHGAVETVKDAKIYADYFIDNRKDIQGFIVTLPNFGDELGIVETLERAGLKVPVLVHAWDDKIEQMDMPHRRDAFCGKLSVCNNLYQRNIAFTNTTLHTCSIESKEFEADLDRFGKICSVVTGLRGARLGAIGQRPNPFNTVRYSEKLLQDSGISVATVDLSEIIFEAQSMGKDQTRSKVDEINSYGKIEDGAPSEHVEKSAALSVAVEKWIEENDIDASAIQCWDSIQKNYGCATCLTMSMMGESGKPSACETDVMGALSMLALQLASGEPSGFLDWNNNFNDNRDMCVNIHCSNYPKSFIGGDFEIGYLDILGKSLGKDKCFGALKTQVKAGPMTYARISTDDAKGKIKVYLGEGVFTDDPVDTVGGVAVCRIDNLQGLMNYLCENGFEHHVAMNRGLTAGVLEEAFSKYMGWEVYHHKG